jgi:hypothetical protein
LGGGVLARGEEEVFEGVWECEDFVLLHIVNWNFLIWYLIDYFESAWDSCKCYSLKILFSDE